MIHLGSAQNIRPRCTERKDPQRRHLCEGKACFVVHFEDFFNGVDIGCCSEVQPEVILVGCAHDLLKGEKRVLWINKAILKPRFTNILYIKLTYTVFEGHHKLANLSNNDSAQTCTSCGCGEWSGIRNAHVISFPIQKRMKATIAHE